MSPGWKDCCTATLPHERFQRFIERLRRPDVTIALLEEYPVLVRQLVICIDQWARPV